MRKRRLTVISLLALLTALIFSTACSSGDSSQMQESGRRQSSYDTLVANQPAHFMNYSPTRDRINFWIDTWSVPDKLSFVYILAANGQKVGYYVFKGLPVTYCALLTPDYEIVSIRSTLWKVKPPSVDGVYYSGGQCNQYFGEDATLGQYMEFTAGGSLNFLVYESPLPLKVEPLGFTRVEDVLNTLDPEIREMYLAAQGEAPAEGEQDGG